MDNISLAPYLFFKGNAKEAMAFYKSIFGGDLDIQTMGEVPKEAQMPGADPNSVMHAALKGPVNIFASDSPQASDKTAKVELSLGGANQDQLHKIFDGLAAGGKVRMPLEKQFWGDTFGMLTDKFGVDWMVNIEVPKSS
jgi:PhnB protein